ncbi:MAG: membrane protein insertase YidC [Anaerolineae bacterium]|nr:membrane protein insertase YidC [Anaerolineae bacterium]
MWDTIIITPFTNVLLFIYTITGQNFGIAIILFTILIRLVTHPLMVSQIKGGQAMQTLQSDPRYKELQEKYKNDKEKLAQEQAALLKELGVNPFASCLPLLVQFPIIIGLYQSLYKAMANTPFDMLNLTRHLYPFLDITRVLPINNEFLWFNLSQPEKLFVPFLSFGIPILAILVMITTYVQSKLISPPPSGDSKDQTAMMTNMMNLYMPFLMGYMGLTLASGLSLYFVVSNVIGILQYALLGKANWRNVIPSFKPKAEVVDAKGDKKKMVKAANRGKK